MLIMNIPKAPCVGFRLKAGGHDLIYFSNDLRRQVLFFSEIYRYKHRESQWLENFPMITQLIRGRFDGWAKSLASLKIALCFSLHPLTLEEIDLAKISDCHENYRLWVYFFYSRRHVLHEKEIIVPLEKALSATHFTWSDIFPFKPST